MMMLQERTMLFALLSDTHSLQAFIDDSALAKADMILVAGDISNPRDSTKNLIEVENALEWLNSYDKPVVFTPGNHDVSFERNLVDYSKYKNIHVLIHQEKVINDIVFFGSSYTPTFGTGWAYNKDRKKLDRVWSQISEDVEVLITHGPPKGILDSTNVPGTKYVEKVGCKSLLNHVFRIEPKLHVFGHIHDEPHIFNSGSRRYNNIDFVNASIMKNGTLTINHPILYTYL